MRGVLSSFGEKALSGKSTLEQFFSEIDKDGTGSISREEWVGGMTRWGKFNDAHASDSERLEQLTNMNAFFGDMDGDGNGVMEYPELLRTVSQYKVPGGGRGCTMLYYI